MRCQEVRGGLCGENGKMQHVGGEFLPQEKQGNVKVIEREATHQKLCSSSSSLVLCGMGQN